MNNKEDKKSLNKLKLNGHFCPFYYDVSEVNLCVKDLKYFYSIKNLKDYC